MIVLYGIVTSFSVLKFKESSQHFLLRPADVPASGAHTAAKIILRQALVDTSNLGRDDFNNSAADHHRPTTLTPIADFDNPIAHDPQSWRPN